MSLNYWSTYINPGEYMRELGMYLRERGHAISFVNDDVLALTVSKGVLIRESDQRILARETPLCSPFPRRKVILDTLQFKLELQSIEKSLYIVDPHIFPLKPRPFYAETFMDIFGTTFMRCQEVEIATSAHRNQPLEEKIINEIKAQNPDLTVSVTYTENFDTQYWIIDKERGIWVNSALEKTGKQYTLLDDLDPKMIPPILKRCKLKI